MNSNGWTYIGAFFMSVAGVLVTVGVVWGSLKTGLEETRADVKEIKEDVKDIQHRLTVVETERTLQ